MNTDQPVFPVKVSHNGRYFIDSAGKPFFWLGTTQWQIFRDNTLDEAKTILENVKGKGFSVVQAMLLGVGGPVQPNVYGEMPWSNNNPLTPNEAYFENVDSVVEMARRNGLVISMTLYHQRFGDYMNPKNARPWAKWIAQRYKNVPNIIWSMTPRANQEYVPILRELAAGLQEGDGGFHIIYFKPDPAPYSSSFIHKEPWLAFNSIQTWKSVNLIYPMVTKDYGLKPVKPVVMGEGAYEEGTEYGFDVTPLWIRRQAYYSYLAGGYHSYGHNDSWRVLPTWKKSLDAPGASQMSILRKIFLDLEEWWRLGPDQSIFARGGQTEGDILNLAARHENGKWIIAYFGFSTAAAINMDKTTASNTIRGLWINPSTGMRTPIGGFPNKGVRSFTTLDGWEDALLVLETA
ncbi:MAG: DUF4038 domain-containing protein [Candidatus Bathyarchaeia archaeon]